MSPRREHRSSAAATLRLCAVAGLAAGIVVALLEASTSLAGAFGGAALLGVAALVALQGTAGLLVCLLLGGLSLLAVRAGAIERALARTRDTLVSLARTASPAIEARGLGALTAILLAGLPCVVTLFVLIRRAIPEIVAEPLAALWFAGLSAAVMAACASVFVLLLPRTARTWAPLCERFPRAATRRSVLVLCVMAVAVICGVLWHPLLAFARAVPVAVPVLLALWALVAGGTLVFGGPSPGFMRLTLVVTSRSGSPVVGALLVGLWILALGPASDHPRAVRMVRADAPLTSGVIPSLAALLDLDGDGFSAHFGDGDCAPFDPARHPTALEIAGNGIDEDCFDGDRTGPALSFAPPPPGARPEGLPENLSFVLLIIDTLRADHTGVYGYLRPTTPNLDAFSRESVVFRYAYAASAYTSGSVPSILTSRYPSENGREVMRRARERLKPGIPVLQEALRGAGWRTALVTGASPRASYGLERGFQSSKVLHRKTRKVVSEAVRFLDAVGDDRFFLVVHLWGPHSPYVVRPGQTTFGSRIIDRYDAQVRFTDDELAPLLRRLGSRGMRSRSVIAVISDHGEAFGEHGHYYHCCGLHDEVVRVPFIVSAPGVMPRVVESAPVSLVDVAPTFLTFAGLKGLPGARGQDLTKALFTGELDPGRHVFIEADYPDVGYQSAVVTRDTKLIVEEKTRQILLYDLASDPGETTDISANAPERLRRLRRAHIYFRTQAARR